MVFTLGCGFQKEAADTLRAWFRGSSDVVMAGFDSYRAYLVQLDRLYLFYNWFWCLDAFRVFRAP